MSNRKVDTDPVHEALDTLPYGLYIIGSRGADNVNGMMADWVMQVSFSPRLVAVSLERNSTTLKNVRHHRYFTVNVLHSGDKALAAHFCQPRDASKVVGRSDGHSTQIYDKMANVDHRYGESSDCPILGDALAYVECELHELVDVGDHTLAIGMVLDGALVREGEPLTSRSLGWLYAG
jgi:flavin reductase (DIM6/NTAB) family NADH-FMN oxidoreductase RutF